VRSMRWVLETWELSQDLLGDRGEARKPISSQQSGKQKDRQQ
jgi:hypothetical protein